MQIETIYGPREIKADDPLRIVKVNALQVAVNAHDVPNIIDSTNQADLSNFIQGALKVREELGIPQTQMLPEAAAAIALYQPESPAPVAVTTAPADSGTAAKKAEMTLLLLLLAAGTGLYLWHKSRNR